MSGLEDTGDGEDNAIPVKAVETGDIVRQRRLKSIFQAKDDCSTIRRKAQNVVSKVGGGEYTANSHYRHALETYIREAEPLFSQTQAGRQYWSTHKFGEIVLEPQVDEKDIFGEPTDYWHPETGAQIPEKPTTETIEIRGLGSLFELESPVATTLDTYVKRPGRGRGYESQTVRAEGQINFQTLDKMYAVTNGYLAEIGLDIELETDENDEWEI